MAIREVAGGYLQLKLTELTARGRMPHTLPTDEQQSVLE